MLPVVTPQALPWLVYGGIFLQLFKEHEAIHGVWEFKKKRVISFVDAGNCSIFNVVEYIILIYYVYLHYVQDTKS